MHTRLQFIIAAVLLVAGSTLSSGQTVAPNGSPLQQLQPQPTPIPPPRRIHRNKDGKVSLPPQESAGVTASPTIGANIKPSRTLEGRQNNNAIQENGQPQAQPTASGESERGRKKNVVGIARAKAKAQTISPEKKQSYAEALKRCHHDRHDRVWWHQHFTVIVLVGGGYYYLDNGYWFPAWGYDPGYETYDNDGPIYTYGNLLPDQVIVNVQRALKDLGYYGGETTGSLGATTRQAISDFQQDAGLEVTGTVDAATVEALGLLG